jgi:hypothetical protein
MATSDLGPHSRTFVFSSIDSERDYQDARWGASLSGGRPATQDAPGGSRSVDEYILYISGYSDKLKDLGATTDDTLAKLNFVRKVAGLCVACMEQHGAPRREGY